MKIMENITEKLKFRKDYPESDIDLDELAMILSASAIALRAFKKRKPSMQEIIQFSRVVVAQRLCKVCPSNC
jgi:hypothetical protein